MSKLPGESYASRLKKPDSVRKNRQSAHLVMDEDYYDRLAVFGLACLAASIVGKLMLKAQNDT